MSKGAPNYGRDSDEDVCDFIDKYVSVAIPENECKLKELVLLLQRHKHSSYCKRGRKCRFNFPQPPSRKTLIASPITDETCDMNEISKALSKVREELVNSNTDVSIDQLLSNIKVCMNDYEEAI